MDPPLELEEMICGERPFRDLYLNLAGFPATQGTTNTSDLLLSRKRPYEEGEEEEEEEEEEVVDSDEECESDEDDYYVLDLMGNLRLEPCYAGANCTDEKAREIHELSNHRDVERFAEYCEMLNNNITPQPVYPMRLLPKISENCTLGYCYHQQYKTDDISETSSTLSIRRPDEMIQFFALRLSWAQARHISIYGYFAVRDRLDHLRNYLFRRSRDDAATIPAGTSNLPLRSPCRGIYTSQYVLVEFDLWIKEEGIDGSADVPLVCGCSELDADALGFDRELKQRIHGDYHGLDVHYVNISSGIPSTIEVFARVDRTSHVKFTAFTSGFDEEIELYDDTFCGTGTILKHIISLKIARKLQICLNLDGSLYCWIFEAGVGVLEAPQDPVSEFAHFDVRVSFGAKKGKSASTSC